MTLLQKLRSLAATEAKATPGPRKSNDRSGLLEGLDIWVCPRTERDRPQALTNRHFISESRNLLKAAIALVEAQHEALKASQKVLETVNAFIDDIGKSNPGWIGKLVLQRYDVMNEAYIGLERQPKKNSAALQLANQEHP